MGDVERNPGFATLAIHGAGAIRADQYQRLGGDDLLYCRRARLGAACDAASQLDGKTRR